MKSLRTRLALSVMLLLGASLAAYLLSNRLLMEPWFIISTQRTMLETLVDFRQETVNGTRVSAENLRRIAAETGLRVMVSDRSGWQVASAAPEFGTNNRVALPKDQLEYFRLHLAELESGQVLTMSQDRGDRGQSVVQLMAKLEGDRYLVITQALKQVRDNVAMAERFFLLIGLLILPLGFGAALLLARQIVQPITAMNDLAGRIAELDFSGQYTGHAKDEVGQLGASMNIIVKRLSQAFTELQESNGLLRDQMAIQRRFVASVSHEFKTPLGLIRGYTESIADGIARTKAQRGECAGIILEETERLEHLINDLIQLASLGNPGFAIKKTRIDLPGLLEKTSRRFNAALQHRKIRLVTDAGGVGILAADEARLVQALDNLVANALRHACEDSNLRIIARQEESRVILEVANSGPRIPEEDLTRLFDPFFRSGTDRSRSTGGSGLGLSIVREIMHLHGGSCRIENLPDGVCVRLELPALTTRE